MNLKTQDLKGDFSRYASDLNEAFRPSVLAALEDATLVIEEAFLNSKKIFIAGNGGSAATASHMMCDLQKTSLGKKHEISKRIKAIALSDNMPLMTAWGNDHGFDFVFSEQLRSLGEAGDVLLVISASGNSPNVLEALKAAKELSMKSVGFLGFSGGHSKSMVDVPIVVESSHYGVIEDAHSVFMHMMTESFKKMVQELD